MPSGSLQRGKLPPPNECPGYDIKQSDDKAPSSDIWEVSSSPSLQLLPGPLSPGVVAPNRVLSMGQIKLLDIQTASKQITYAKLN